MRRATAFAIALLLAGAAQAADPPAVVMRTGQHVGFGRVVFDLPPGITAADPVREGDRLAVHFTPARPVVADARAPRNVRGITAAPGEADLTLAPGARVRRMRLGRSLVIDVLDPFPASPRAGPRRREKPAPAAPASAKPVVTVPQPLQPAPTAPTAPTAPIATTVSANSPPAAPPPPPTPPVATGPPDGPIQLAATPVPPPPGATGRAVLLPFDVGVGAAAFRRGDDALVVFDARKPIDMAALRGDPAFASAVVQLLPAGTLLRFALPAQDGLRLARGAAGWTVMTLPAATQPNLAAPADPAMSRPILPQLVDGALHMSADAPGQIVSVPDPETGLMLLVGTQRQPGENLANLRRTPEFVLLPTWLGVAVEPVSDALSVIAAAPGFTIEAAAGGKLALTAASPEAILTADARHFSRRFDFPAMPIRALRQRLVEAVDAAAATPLQARAPERLAVAQAMLALGMGAEAQSVVTLAATGDGRVADDPDAIGLSAIGALMAGRISESAGIDDPRLTGTDEVALWRAVRSAMSREGAPDAAPVFAANLPLLLAYPAPLRRRLLPLAAETMAQGGEQGGERAAAKQLVDQRPDDTSLDLARGLLADPQSALAIFDRLAQGRDRLVRARAATAAVEIRLADGTFSPAQAADALDRLMYSWRGDGRELALREREAELRRQAGQWRPALALLRETEQIWPDERPTLRPAMAKIFAEALAQDEKTPLSPLDLVALVEENADLIPDGDAGQAVAARLADRLVALDLPGRAIPVLEKLASQAPAGPVQAAFGGRLAAMRMDQGDAPGALAALTRSAAPNLPPPLLESRTLIFARAAAAAGDLPSATAALAALATPAANLLRADLLEAHKDWPAAEAALRDVVASSVSPTGMLDETQGRILLRLASAAAQAGDEAGLTDLREHVTSRLPPGKLADMFRVLTAGPVSGLTDLPQAAQETKLAGSLSADLKTLVP